jgi:hypothetical protein
LAEYPTLAGHFLAMLRFWYEQARNRAEWGQLRLVMAYAAELDIPLQAQQSPFNVGLPIDLPPFTTDQVKDLMKRHRLANRGIHQAEVERLVAQVGGHPYLLQLAFYWLQSGQVTLEQVVDQAATDEGIYGEYLHRMWAMLQQSPPLQAAWQEVLTADSPVPVAVPLARRLEAMGLIQMAGGQAKARCPLCQAYFTALYRDW